MCGYGKPAKNAAEMGENDREAIVRNNARRLFKLDRND